MNVITVLITYLKEKIMDSGKIHKIKSDLRHEILEILGISSLKKMKKPEQPPDIILLNNLIKEYLIWLGYSYTSYMLSSESGIPHWHKLMRREQMEADLNLVGSDFDNSRPLLLQLIQKVKNE
ncbi:centrosomal protein 20 isoform X2 [Rhodnius prolixus]|uniref:LisH domain-containing protein n=2 Tax=Rhodnius prolixus TaxID=13249 RepID=T1I6C2_RHOPR